MPEEKAVAVPQSLEDRLTNKLREDLGGIITDEELAQITERCIERILFKPILESENYGKKHYRPSAVEASVEKYLKAAVQASADKYLAENSERLIAIIDKQCERQFEDLFLASLGRMFSGSLDAARNVMAADMQQIVSMHENGPTHQR